MYWARSTMCAPMSPSAPGAGLVLSQPPDQRRLPGRRSSPAGTAPARAGCCPSRPVGDQLPGQRDRRHPAVGEADHRPHARAPRPRSAAAAIASASATVLASGFSHSTCLPASSAAIAISAWVSPGVQMSTRSMSSRSTSARQSVSVDAQPSRSGRGARRAVGVPAGQHGQLPGRSGRSKKRGAVRQAWEWAAPMKA